MDFNIPGGAIESDGQEGIGNNCTKFGVNPTNRCGDIKYLNLKRATWWSSANILHRALGAHGEVVT